MTGNVNQDFENFILDTYLVNSYEYNPFSFIAN